MNADLRTVVTLRLCPSDLSRAAAMARDLGADRAAVWRAAIRMGLWAIEEDRNAFLSRKAKPREQLVAPPKPRKRAVKK